jgi:hypothetical protein
MTIEFDYPLNEEINRNVSAALAEDVGAGDLTASLVPGERRVKATVISREAGVLCGTAWFDECVRRCDPTAKVTWQGADGDRIAANQLLCEIEGNGRALLTAERSASTSCNCCPRWPARFASMPTPSPAPGRRSSIPARPCPACALPRNTRCAPVAAAITASPCGTPS